MILIIQFKEQYTQDVIDLVLHFQNDGTRPPVTVADQPDLLTITDSYINAGGNFWIATENEKLIGSIGIMPCGKDIAILKISSFILLSVYATISDATTYILLKPLYIPVIIPGSFLYFVIVISLHTVLNVSSII